jgi:hypothetical protein
MKIHLIACLVVGTCALPGRAVAQTAERLVVDDAAQALGGRDQVLAPKSLLVEGAGHDMNVGQSLRYDELGLQSDVYQIRGYRRAYDLANGRARFEATRQGQYPFYQGNPAVRQVQGLDGAIAYNVAPNGTAARVFAQSQIDARRVEFLRHPLTIVHAALQPGATLANGRTQNNERLVDVTTGGVTVTPAIDSTTKLPTRVIQMTDSATLGDTLVSTEFRDYKGVSGLQLPTRITGKLDRFVNLDVRIQRQSLTADLGDLAAPPAVASARPPANAAPPAAAWAPTREIAQGVWFGERTTHHSLLVEFADHLMLIEAPNNERTAAVLAKAKELRPNKPVTVLLVTHHHGDHTGGIRDAVAKAPIPEIVTHRSNVAYVNDVLNRPHTMNPDALAKKGGAKGIKVTAIDDQRVVKDATMTMNLYHPRQQPRRLHADDLLSPGTDHRGRHLHAQRRAQHHSGRAARPRALEPEFDGQHQPAEAAGGVDGADSRRVLAFSLFVENTIAMTQYVPGTEPTATTGGAGRGGGEGGSN